MTNQTLPAKPDTCLLASDFQAEPAVRDANAQKFFSSTKPYADQCFLCGRPLTAKAVENGSYIHLTTSGFLVERDYEGDDSQGCFPVGSECAKRIPRPFKFKFSA